MTPTQSEHAQTEAMYAAAIEFAAEKASISYVQRKCRCSYNDAERMLERMVSEGIIETYGGRKTVATTPSQPAAPQGAAKVNWWEVDGDKYDDSITRAPPAPTAQVAPATQQAGEVRPVTPYTCPKCHALWLHWPAEQTGFGRDTLNCRSADHCHYCEKAGVEQLQRLERIPAALHAPHPSPTAQAAPAADPAYSEACSLATALFEKHYRQEPDYASGRVVWSLCDTTAGVISQIDNMVSGLARAPAAGAVAGPSEADREELEAVIACLGDDAATLRDQNPECEMAANMDRAAEMLAAAPTPAAQADSQPALAPETASAMVEGMDMNDRVLAAIDAETRADSVLEDAARLELERICAAIKAEDDYCVEHGDYMLDSDDCIKIVRGEWVRPDFSVAAARKQGGA